MQNKTDLRHFYRARRDAFFGAERDSAQNTIIATLARVLAREDCRCIAIYLAVRGEANINELPRVLANEETVFAAPASYDLPPQFRELKLKKIGARFPDEAAPEIAPQGFDAILVPGIAFDESGNRLGQGGGWYDRVLAEAPRALKIGVAFECQIVAQLPRESHDVRMDFVITERRCVVLPKEKPLTAETGSTETAPLDVE